MSDQRIRQSVCPVCGETANPGTAVVLAFGAGGRVHRAKCLAIAQKVALTVVSPQSEATTLQASQETA